MSQKRVNKTKNPYKKKKTSTKTIPRPKEQPRFKIRGSYSGKRAREKIESEKLLLQNNKKSAELKLKEITKELNSEINESIIGLKELEKIEETLSFLSTIRESLWGYLEYYLITKDGVEIKMTYDSASLAEDDPEEHARMESEEAIEKFRKHGTVSKIKFEASDVKGYWNHDFYFKPK